MRRSIEMVDFHQNKKADTQSTRSVDGSINSTMQSLV